VVRGRIVVVWIDWPCDHAGVRALLYYFLPTRFCIAGDWDMGSWKPGAWEKKVMT
jgi:hypothetical protein